MHIAMLPPIVWRTPPLHYGPWENVASLLTEGLVSCGHDVTLFANRLYPGSLDALAHVCAWGPTVILSDGDVVLQPRKVQRSWLWDEM